MLDRGCRGVDVRDLQHNLRILGFDPGPVDGVFGRLTEEAVKSFQEYCGLTVDGTVGYQTEQALFSLLPHEPNRQKQLSEHFKEWEFHCRCGCSMVMVNVRLVIMLEGLRSVLGGKPIIITSGYRCSAHNRAVRGAPKSQHMKGNAADIVVAGAAPEDVAAAAEALGFPGVGRLRRVHARGRAEWRLGKVGGIIESSLDDETQKELFSSDWAFRWTCRIPDVRLFLEVED